ncbi:MAG: hypothetical protein M3Q00_06590 [Pseudomonadota bacterium]|nr:hypothetical protein [Pseudomonadota bacterium]
MATHESVLISTPAGSPRIERDSADLTRAVITWLERLLIPIGAIVVGFAICAAFLLIVTDTKPLAVFESIYRAGFGSWFSFQKTLIRAAPLKPRSSGVFIWCAPAARTHWKAAVEFPADGLGPRTGAPGTPILPLCR